MDPEPAEENEDGLLGLDFAETTGDPVSLQNMFDRVKGYNIETDLDRQLLLGVWKNEDKTKKGPLQTALASISGKQPVPANQISLNQSSQMLHTVTDFSNIGPQEQFATHTTSEASGLTQS